MIAVFRYVVAFGDGGRFEVDMREGAEILGLEYDGDGLGLFALVDTNRLKERRFFRLVETGQELEPSVEHKYVGPLHDETEIRHVLEIR